VVQWQKFAEVAASRKKEDKPLLELTTLLKQCKESQIAINLHSDILRDRYYRDSVRVWDYREFTLYIRQFGLPALVLFEYYVDEKQESYECAKFLIIDCLEKGVQLRSFRMNGISHNRQKDVKPLLTAFQTRSLLK
jgi:hypothetical protein